MKNRLIIFMIVLSIFGLTTFSVVPSFAEEAQDIVELKKQIEILQKRVDELEGEKQNKEDQNYGLRKRSPGQFGLRWNPFEEMQQMQEEMDRMFQDSFGRSGPTQGMFSSNMSFDYGIDLKEIENGYEIIFDMAGLDEEKMDIQINEYSMTVKGEYAQEQTKEGSDKYFHAQSYGSFMKTIPLPADADTKEIVTEKKDGKLIVRLGKKKSE